MYSGTCQICEEEKPTPESNSSVYIGETSRTIYVRVGQHMKDYRSVNRATNLEEESSSWMDDHYKACHPDVEGTNPDNDFKFQILSNHRDPLSRQLEEAIRINNALETGLAIDRSKKKVCINSLNRRGEAFAPYQRWDPDKNL